LHTLAFGLALVLKFFTYWNWNMEKELNSSFSSAVDDSEIQRLHASHTLLTFGLGLVQTNYGSCRTLVATLQMFDGWMTAVENWVS
jgi:hypothetical protein